MKTSIKLMPRDLAILDDCYSHAVMSFSQIQRRHFRDKSVATISNRLGQLRRAGYLRRTRVSVPILMDDPGEIGVVFQVTRRALMVLKDLKPDDPIRSEPHPLNLLNLTHDILLNDTLAALNCRFPDSKVIHGRLFPIQNKSGARHPDAVILERGGKTKVAVELELTAKSDARYRSILIQYMTSSDYSKVLYILPGTRTMDRIREHITHQKVIPGLPRPSTGKFFFARLPEILKDPKKAPISNGSCELTLN
jgi:hypothetical protein